jgi:hypothetical protein
MCPTAYDMQCFLNHSLEDKIKQNIMHPFTAVLTVKQSSYQSKGHIEVRTPEDWKYLTRDWLQHVNKEPTCVAHTLTENVTVSPSGHVGTPRYNRLLSL